MNELPNDSWFTEEELTAQKARNIHARFWHEVEIDDPHAQTPDWWMRFGRKLYRSWKNATYECDQCDTECEVADIHAELASFVDPEEEQESATKSVTKQGEL